METLRTSRKRLDKNRYKLPERTQAYSVSQEFGMGVICSHLEQVSSTLLGIRPWARGCKFDFVLKAQHHRNETRYRTAPNGP